MNMNNLKLLILALSCSLVLSCSSTKDVKDMYLVLKVYTTSKYEQYAYVNQDGQTVVPYNRYLLCYTDTIRTIGFVFKPNVGCVAINNNYSMYLWLIMGMTTQRMDSLES